MYPKAGIQKYSINVSPNRLSYSVIQNERKVHVPTKDIILKRKITQASKFDEETYNGTHDGTLQLRSGSLLAYGTFPSDHLPACNSVFICAIIRLYSFRITSSMATRTSLFSSPPHARHLEQCLMKLTLKYLCEQRWSAVAFKSINNSLETKTPSGFL